MTASSILNENIKIRDNSLRHFQDDSRLMILNNSKVAGFLVILVKLIWSTRFSFSLQSKAFHLLLIWEMIKLSHHDH